ncbi:hypothetical protein [Nocardioides sp. WS12]|uniref:hypothetical protein n=1 Tax=Nocardioides sp. WS12 TaxID=2486272 RepID=UPI0015FE2183|nr:hypothetical protein [Nocardioides sp. WS12]
MTVGIIMMLGPGSPERAVDDARPRTGDDLTTLPTEPAAPTKSKKAVPAADTDALPLALQSNFPGLGAPPGISGDSDVFSLPKHKLTIRLSAPSALGPIAYVIPTSMEHSQGTLVENGRTWSLTTTVYGNPDYAVVFVQAGPGGQPESCVITVDGRVTERRSTEGPYGAMWCQG